MAFLLNSFCQVELNKPDVLVKNNVENTKNKNILLRDQSTSRYNPIEVITAGCSYS